MRSRRARPLLGIDAQHADVAGGAPPVALEDLHRRRPARAVRAEQGEDLPTRDRQVDPRCCRRDRRRAFRGCVIDDGHGQRRDPQAGARRYPWQPGCPDGDRGIGRSDESGKVSEIRSAGRARVEQLVRLTKGRRNQRPACARPGTRQTAWLRARGLRRPTALVHSAHGRRSEAAGRASRRCARCSSWRRVRCHRGIHQDREHVPHRLHRRLPALV